MIPGFRYDPDLVAVVADRFDLRTPNRDAFEKVVQRLAAGYDLEVPLVLDLATGAGKTYIMAALVEYLRLHGIHDALIITPGRVVRAKTVANFERGSGKHIEGALVDATVVTPDSYDTWRPAQENRSLFAAGDDTPMQLFVLTVHQLLPPREAEGETGSGKQGAQQRSFRRVREQSGNLHEYLRSRPNLVVIADEHHLYSDTAAQFQAGIRELSPAAIVGLTASASGTDDVIHQYPLRRAIQDRFVKRPVIAFRKGGYGQREEEQQLRDALALLSVKADHYKRYVSANPGTPDIHPVLFVQCEDVAHATAIAQLLRGPEFLGSTVAVLQVDTQHEDAATLDALRDMDRPGSPVRAVVSVNKLKEGWDVRNVAVMVTLRPMGSEILTQQVLGRGLRLPFGKWTGIRHIDQLDVLGHDSFRNLLRKEDVLKSFGMEELLHAEKQTSPDPHLGDKRGRVGPDATIDARHSDATSAPLDPDEMEGGETPEGDHDDGVALPTSDSKDVEVVDLGGGVVAVVIDDDAEIGEDEPPVPVRIAVNAEFEGQTFTFPSTTVDRETSAFRLSRISAEELRAAARRIKDQDGVLVRESIVFRRDRIATSSEEDVRVGDIHVDASEAQETLINSLKALRVYDSSDPQNLKTIRNFIVPTILAASGVTEWTTKRIGATVGLVREVIEKAATDHARGLGTRTKLHPIKLPIRTEYYLPAGEGVLDVLEGDATSADFTRNAHYGPWAKGLFDAASFESFSGEYRVAALLNRAQSIRWWTRLYPADRAVIAYTERNNYWPDFVALDTDGVYWIIEAKSELGKDDEVVRMKRKAAEEAIVLLSADPLFESHKWGYVLAFESDVRASDSWENLVSRIEPVTTPGVRIR